MASTTAFKVPLNNPFQMLSSQQRSSPNGGSSSSSASSSRPIEPSSSAHLPPPPAPADTTSKAFGRIRETFRTATRTRKPAAEDAPTVTARGARPKEKVASSDETTRGKEKDRTGVNLMGIYAKVTTFRRPRRESLTPSPQTTSYAKNNSSNVDQVRKAGFTSYITPSLRQASMSSPTLLVSVDGLPSSPSPTKARPAVPLSSFTPSVPESPITSPAPSSSKNRSRSSSLQPAHPQISAPLPLAPRRDHRNANSHAPHPERPSRHRSTRSTPIAVLPSSPSTVSVQSTVRTSTDRQELRSSSRREQRERKERDLPHPPEPSTRTRTSLGSRDPTNRANVGPTGTLTPSTTPARDSPSPAAPATPSRARSGSRTRVVTPTQRGLVSPSQPQLVAHSPTPSSRHPSVDAPRRPSVELTRKESATLRRSSGGASSQFPGRGESSSPPLIRPRATSPAQRSYAQNRHYSVSTASLVTSGTTTTVPTGTSNPELRELIRTASSILCKDVGKPPLANRSESFIKDWEEVDFRLRTLIRLERSWSTNVVGASGEERERRAFVDALRDGFVLCYYMNHLRQSSVVRPSSREDGIHQTANITKFLAACSSYGLPEEDLFHKEDLLESTSESLARVAKTVIALSKFVPSLNERSKILMGGTTSKKDTPLPSVPPPPSSVSSTSASGSGTGTVSSSTVTAVSKAPSAYPLSSSRAAASTPTLIAQSSATQLPLLSSSTSPISPLVITPSSPTTKRRWSPPTPLPTVRSNSSNEDGSSGDSESNTTRHQKSQKSRDNDQSATESIQEVDLDRYRMRETQLGPSQPSPTRPPLRSKSTTNYKRQTDDAGVSMWLQKISHSTGPLQPAPAGSPPRTRYGPGGIVDPERSSSSNHFGPPISGSAAYTGAHYPRSSLAESTRASIGDASIRDSAVSFDRPMSLATTASMTNMRQSVASTAITVVSSILDARSRTNSITYYNNNHSTGSQGGGGGQGNKYGTIRTINTDITSEGVPSIGKAEGMGIAEEVKPGRRSSGSSSQYVNDLGALSNKMRDRKDSEAPTHDLTRVAEETEGSCSSKGRHGSRKEKKERGRERRARDREKGQGSDVEMDRDRERTRAPPETPPPKTHFPSRSQSQTKHRNAQTPVPIPAVNLRKGKWPDDFIDAFDAPKPGPWGLSTEDLDLDEWSIFDSTPSNRNHISSSSSQHVSIPTPPPPPFSVSPPRKIAIVGVPRRPSNSILNSYNSYGNSDAADANIMSASAPILSQFPARRPTHRPRNSVDGPVLLPKEAALVRHESSPDRLVSGSPGKVQLRRSSTSRTGLGERRGVYVPKGYLDERRNSGSGGSSRSIEREKEEGDSLVPFPRAVSGDLGRAITLTARASAHEDGLAVPAAIGASGNIKLTEPPRMRGRFSSEVEGSKRRRPTSYDEVGARLERSRIGSMVNLGVASANASASDLLNRDSTDGSAYRKTLVVKDEGKPPTHFQLGNCIGRGQFGSVYRALNLNTGQMVAVKSIRLEGLKEEEVTQLMQEVDLVKSLSHPSIVKYEGMVRDSDSLNIVLEYAENGSLAHTIKAFGKLNERLVTGYVVKILEGLHYLHTSDVVHCDLKAANILTTKTGNVKLSDFGVSLNLRAMEKDNKDVAGTPNWMAPEVIELKGASTKSDIWSLGCTVVELLTGRPPYADVPNSMTVMFRIVEDEMPPLPEDCSELLKDFLQQCFQKDPDARPSADILCEHPWLKQIWGIHKELRPQDSIPFLRRVSADLNRVDVVRHLFRDSLVDNGSEHGSRTGDGLSSSGAGRRVSNASLRPLADSEFSPRDHSFVKTTFSKPMICRVCLLAAKKNAVLCEQCSLIAHVKCAQNAPPTCDFRAQLLRYANFAEQSNSSSLYSNPLDILNDARPAAPGSDVAYVSHSHSTPRTSIDGSPAHNEHAHAPNAMKLINKAFKRSRSNLNHEISGQSAPPQPAPYATRIPPPSIENESPRKPSAMNSVQAHQERPISLASASTDRNSSMRSAATAAESFSSQTQRSIQSTELEPIVQVVQASGGSEPRTPRSSRITTVSISVTSEAGTTDGIPGGLQPDSNSKRSKKKGDPKSGNCIIQ